MSPDWAKPPLGVLCNQPETIMQIDYTFLKTHALNNLKLAQKQFMKNPNTINWEVATTAMLVYQQVHSLRNDKNFYVLRERLIGLPLGDWSEAIVRHSTGLSVRDILMGVTTLTQA